MNAIRLRLRFFLVVFLAVVVVGTVGFMLIEKKSLGDAFYFCIVTVATVGYGDISPATPLGKALSVVLIVVGVGTFLGVIGNAVELMLTRREAVERLEKLNMVIGVFFSEVGTRLLTIFSDADPDLDELRGHLLINGRWADEDFRRVAATLKQRKYTIDLARLDLDDLCAMLVAKREFLVRLLENPALLEHASFTDLMWAVFHLTEELSHRKDRSALPDTDRAHLAGDTERAYGRLVGEWVDYMRHLKAKYPYLFSLAIRTNPFDESASPVVT